MNSPHPVNQIATTDFLRKDGERVSGGVSSPSLLNNRPIRRIHHGSFPTGAADVPGPDSANHKKMLDENDVIDAKHDFQRRQQKKAIQILGPYQKVHGSLNEVQSCVQ
jgi:hypothetical protein